MKTKTLLAFLFLSVSTLCSGQFIPPANMVWEGVYGDTHDDSPGKIVPTLNGNYFISGINHRSGGHVGMRDLQVFLVDGQGNELERFVYDFGRDEYGITDAIATDDGGMLLLLYGECGYGDDRNTHLNYDYYFRDYILMKIDAEGNKVWHRCYGTSRDDLSRWGLQILPSPQGGYYIFGSYDGDAKDGDMPEGYGKADICMLKIDDFGNIEWWRYYGGSESDYFSNALILDDGTIHIISKSASTDYDLQGKLDTVQDWFLTIDSLGNVVQSLFLSFGDSPLHQPKLLMVNTGEILMYGSHDWRYKMTNGHHDTTKYRLDGFYTIIHQDSSVDPLKYYGGRGHNRFREGIITDSSYVFIGYSVGDDGDLAANPCQGFDIWLIEVDITGEILRQSVYGGDGHEYFSDMLVLSPDSILILGENGSNRDPEIYYIDSDLYPPDLWFFQLSSLTYPYKDTSEVSILETEELLFQIYPNPSHGLINVRLPELQESIVLQIYSALGQKVVQETLGQSHTTISVAHLSSGLYICKLRSEEGLHVQMIVINRNQ